MNNLKLAYTPKEVADWFPMEPLKGPPLPRFLELYWPWYKPVTPVPPPPPGPTPAEPPTDIEDVADRWKEQIDFAESAQIPGFNRAAYTEYLWWALQAGAIDEQLSYMGSVYYGYCPPNENYSRLFPAYNYAITWYDKTYNQMSGEEQAAFDAKMTELRNQLSELQAKISDAWSRAYPPPGEPVAPLPPVPPEEIPPVLPTEPSLISLTIPEVPSGAEYWSEAVLYLPPIETGYYGFFVEVDPSYFPVLHHRSGDIPSKAHVMEFSFLSKPMLGYTGYLLDSPNNFYKVKGWKISSDRLLPAEAIYFESAPGAFGGVTYTKKPIPPGEYNLLGSITHSWRDPATYAMKETVWNLGIGGTLTVV